MDNLLRLLQMETPRLNILIIGDTMIDEYYYGEVNRISPEAPVPVFKVNRIEKKLGGAANIAKNISRLGARSILIGNWGEESVKTINELCNENKIMIKGLFLDRSETIIKRRHIDTTTNSQIGLRTDIENIYDIPVKAFTEKMLDGFSLSNQKFDVVILSDYAKGMLNPKTIPFIIKNINARYIIADTKPNHFMDFAHSKIKTPSEMIIKCNFKEFKQIAEKQGLEVVNTDESIERIATNLANQFKISFIITRSEKGISYIDLTRAIHSPVQAKEIMDVTGAGDTVTAVLAISIGVGIPIADSLHLANVAAGISISRMGAVSVSMNDIKQKLIGEHLKIVDEQELINIINKEHNNGRKIVFTNGCFDILHNGHIHLLKEAKRLGDIFIVAINSDESVRRIKGHGRPILDQDARAEMLAALNSVDYVIIYKEDTANRLIQIIRPDVYVKGSDYENRDVPEAKTVRENGGEVEFIQIKKDKKGNKISSSNLIKINE